jgi:hypothetical protein
MAERALDLSKKTFEKARFEKTLRARPELYKENKLSGLLLEFSCLGSL